MSDFEIDDFFGNDDLQDEPTVEDEENKENAVDALFAEEKKDDMAKLKPKRKTPDAAKFNEALLMGPKGIKHLSQICQEFKFDQKLGPFQNMENLMKLYQHWAHVMYPKFKFEDTIAQCEKIGSKRAIKIYMERMRQGLAMSGEEFDQIHGKPKEKEEEKETMDFEPPTESAVSSENLGQHQEQLHTNYTPPVEEPPSVPRPLTDEERKRVAENRLKALQIREQKQQEKELAEKMAKEAEERNITEPNELSGMEIVAETLPEEMLDEENILNELGF